MMDSEIPEEIIELIKSVELSKRGRIVVDHIVAHGSITTEELKTTYGYEHPPRAIRDVREAGIPLKMTWTISSDQRRIGEYRFGDLAQIEQDKLGGRKTFSKEFKQGLYDASRERCEICQTQYEARYLQIDHKVPYEVYGDRDWIERDPSDYMLLCASCNRSKSWSCEQCLNWTEYKDPEICKSCYWASPESYTHIALREVRRADIVWAENEVQEYESLRILAQETDSTIPDYTKRVVRDHIEDQETIRDEPKST